MENTFQTPAQTILQHGQSVRDYVHQLFTGNLSNYQIPDWLRDNRHFLINQAYPFVIINRYTVFHDCGKPFCRTVDEAGKVHFPNHAEISRQKFLEIFPEETEVGELIGLDMIMHTENIEQIKARQLSNQILTTLYLVAWAEICSNSKMFGGFDSVSFKIKAKKLDKLGKRLFGEMIKDNENYAYIFVREDLSPAQRIVQSAHAVFEAVPLNNSHPSLVVLAVKNESKLRKVMSYLIEQNIRFSSFCEPMTPLNASVTAICTEPLIGERRGLLRKYQLLK